MRDKLFHGNRIFGAILIISAVIAFSQPLHSQMVTNNHHVKSNSALIWLFREVSLIENFFTVKESLYEPSLYLEDWMMDVNQISSGNHFYPISLSDSYLVEPDLKLEDWMLDMKCFCKHLPERFCDDALILEEWMCCPFKKDKNE